MTTQEEYELLSLARSNNMMLHELKTFVGHHVLGSKKENTNDMVRNIIANIISN